MERETIWLNEYGSELRSFLFKRGDLVKSKVNGREGIVENAKLEGDLGSTGGGAQKVTYYIKDRNGDVFESPMSQLIKLG